VAADSPGEGHLSEGGGWVGVDCKAGSCSICVRDGCL